jgi:hypothetical protein
MSQANFSLLKKAAERKSLYNKVRGILKATSLDFATIEKQQKEVNLKIDTWQRHGLKTFILSDQLVEAFRNTDLPKDIMTSDLQLPYGSFVIENGKGLLNCLTKMPDKSLQTKTVYHIMVSTAKSLVDFLDIELSKAIHWDIWISGFIHVPESPMSFETISMSYLKNDPMYDENHENPGYEKLDGEEQRHIVNMVCNTVLYINDPKRSKDTERLEKRTILSGETKGPKGKKVKIEQEYIYLSHPASYTGSGDSAGHKIDARFTVRGHWRNQACGKDLQEHRRTWIAPYWKGPSTSEILIKPYKVD